MKIFKRGASDTMLRISTVDVSDHHVGIYYVLYGFISEYQYHRLIVMFSRYKTLQALRLYAHSMLRLAQVPP